MVNLLSQTELNDLFSQFLQPFIARFPNKFKQCPTPNCDNVLSRKAKAVNLNDYIRRKKAGNLKAELNSDDEKLLEKNGEFAKNEAQDADALLEDSSLDSGDEISDGPQKREFVFCECCGHDFCFDCMKNHYGESCEVDNINTVRLANRRNWCKQASWIIGIVQLAMFSMRRISVATTCNAHTAKLTFATNAKKCSKVKTAKQQKRCMTIFSKNMAVYRSNNLQRTGNNCHNLFLSSRK